MQITATVTLDVTDSMEMTPDKAAETILETLGGDPGKGDYCSITFQRPAVTGTAGGITVQTPQVVPPPVQAS